MRAAIFSHFVIFSYTLVLAQSPETDYPVTDNFVNDFAQTNDTLIIAGDFTRLGHYFGSHVAIDRSSDSAILKQPKISGPINKVVPDGSGGWYVIGSFQFVDGIKNPGFAHILHDGSFDDWKLNIVTEDGLSDLVLKDSILYLTGSFNSIQGKTRTRLAAVDIKTKIVTSFNVPIDGGPSYLAVWDSLLIIAGDFWGLGGTTVQNIGAINLYTNSVVPIVSKMTGSVYAMVVNKDILYLGGVMSSVNDVPRKSIASIDLKTKTLTSWMPELDFRVTSLAAIDTTLYIGGEFSTVNGKSRNKFAAFSTSSGSLLDFSIDLKGELLSSIAVDSQYIYVTGLFDSVGGARRKKFAEINRLTGTLTSRDYDFFGYVACVASYDNILFFGGSSISANMQTRHGIAFINLTTKKILPVSYPFVAKKIFEYIFPVGIKTIQKIGGTLLVGGNFSYVDNGDTINNIVQIDIQSGASTSLKIKVNGPILSLVRNGSTLYLHGRFTTVNDSVRHEVAAITLSGNVLEWNPLKSGTVSTIVYHDSTVYLGGSFILFGDSTNRYLGCVDAMSGKPHPWNPYVPKNFGNEPNINTFSIYQNTLYVGGAFSGIDGYARKNGAAFDLVDRSILPWDPNTNGPIYKIAPTQHRTYLGGNFFYVGSQIHIHVGAVDSRIGLAYGWGPHAYDPITTIHIAGSTVFIANAKQFENHTMQYFAAFQDTFFVTGVDQADEVPTSFSLRQNYPNPFNPTTTIEFHIEESGSVMIEVFDLLGRKIKTITDRLYNTGYHRVLFNAQTLSSGTYFYTIRSGKYFDVKKMMVIK